MWWEVWYKPKWDLTHKHTEPSETEDKYRNKPALHFRMLHLSSLCWRVSRSDGQSERWISMAILVLMTTSSSSLDVIIHVTRAAGPWMCFTHVCVSCVRHDLCVWGFPGGFLPFLTVWIPVHPFVLCSAQVHVHWHLHVRVVDKNPGAGFLHRALHLPEGPVELAGFQRHCYGVSYYFLHFVK